MSLGTVETLYNTVNFCWSTHKRHSIARPSSKGNILCRLIKIELYKIFAIINRAIKGLHCTFKIASYKWPAIERKSGFVVICRRLRHGEPKKCCRRQFKMYFCDGKSLYFDENIAGLFSTVQLRICQHWFSKWLTPNRQHAIIWANVGVVHRCIYASIGHYELTRVIKKSLSIPQMSWCNRQSRLHNLSPYL